MIELHDHIGAEVALDLHDQLGREAAARAVDVAAELDAVLIDASQSFEGEHLEAAGIGEDGTIPRHEAMEAAQLAHHVVTGSQMEVVRVGQDHPRTSAPEVLRVERLDGAEGSNRHEHRRFD
jgi:hypothetical protein